MLTMNGDLNFKKQMLAGGTKYVFQIEKKDVAPLRHEMCFEFEKQLLRFVGATYFLIFLKKLCHT